MDIEDSIKQAMKDIEDSLLNDASFSTASNESYEISYEKILQAMALIPKLKPEDNVLGIIITKYAPKEDLGKCQLENGFYILVSKNIWKGVIEEIILPMRYEKNSLGIYGIRIYEDDAFALDVMQKSKEYQEKIVEQWLINVRQFQSQIGIWKRIEPIITAES